MTQRKPAFTASLKEQAWNSLQEAIDAQLRVTPGEYDVFTLAHRIANRMGRIGGLDYLTVIEYLETRYKEQE